MNKHYRTKLIMNLQLGIQEDFWLEGNITNHG